MEGLTLLLLCVGSLRLVAGDATPPAVLSATMDYSDNVKELVVYMSEAVQSASVDPSKIKLNEISSYTLARSFAMSAASAVGGGGSHVTSGALFLVHVVCVTRSLTRGNLLLTCKRSQRVRTAQN